MTCMNCGSGCSARAITVTLANKRLSASEMAVAHYKKLMENKNVLMRESPTPNQDSNSADSLGNSGSAGDPPKSINNHSSNS